MADTDWRAAHRKELLEKQRHIAQKLAQIREFRRLVLKWRSTIRGHRKWLAGMDDGLESSKWFNITAMARMGSVVVQLNRLVGEFSQLGDPKTIGSGRAKPSSKTPTTVSPTPAAGRKPVRLTDKERNAATTEVLIARAGPLAGMAPWELVWHIDPATSESIRQGKTGAAIANVIFNPFTSLAGMGFAKEISKLSKKLIEDHPEEFKALEKGWKDSRGALDSISETLDGIDTGELRKLEDGLQKVLYQYEEVYDGARGADHTSAHRLRQAAAGRKPK